MQPHIASLIVFRNLEKELYMYKHLSSQPAGRWPHGVSRRAQHCCT